MAWSKLQKSVSGLSQGVVKGMRRLVVIAVLQLGAHGALSPTYNFPSKSPQVGVPSISQASVLVGLSPRLPVLSKGVSEQDLLWSNIYRWKAQL